MIAQQSSPARAAEFIAADGSAVFGEIIRFTESTVTIRPAGGSMILLAPDDIKQVRYILSDGSAIEGVLHDWYDGTYVLKVQEKLVGARDGARLSSGLLTRLEEQQGEEDDAGATPALKSAVLEKTPPKPPSVESALEPDDRLEVTTSLGAVDGENQFDLVEIKATADAALEEARELVFEISSSKPWPDDIIVIYTTLDGTAEAGIDFESTKGIVRLPAGTTSIQLTIPLIDDDEAEDDESLTLFLSSALDVATIPKRNVIATIRDSD